MANKHMKTCSTSLGIKEKQIMFIKICHYELLELIIFFKNTKGCGRISHYTAVNAKCCRQFRKQFVIVLQC